MGAAVGDRIVALAGIVGAVGGHRTDLLVSRDLAEQLGQDRCIADVASGDLDGPDLQRLLVDPEVDLAPDPPFGPPCLRAGLSPSPSTLIPVLAIRRCSGPLEPR
ncbi:hypothetical protein U879_17275 [Defluviimonas sp. 20V17]|nr:hypothetical protein U879_17275 [Defluviimonas sp. 20V17]